MRKKYPQIEVKSFEVTGNRENAALLQKVGQELNTEISGIPFTVVGQQSFSGYFDDQTTGKEIEKAVICGLENGCEDVVGNLLTNVLGTQVSKDKIPEIIKLPIIGEIKTQNLSLPLFTFVIALLDGFNPCAMWVLIFLISLLLGMAKRKKMWLLGTTFIAASAFVYFLFMAAWLNLFLFLGFILWIRIIVSFIALIAGAYNLRDYFVNKEGACKVVGGEKRQRVFEKLKKITAEKRLILALIGIVLLAFAVNLIELVCSAGLPAVYTQVLALNQLARWQYYLYLLFYILIFMLDDLLIFFAAMITLQVTNLSGQYNRYSRLIGGALMLIIGLLLLFKPEVLMFG